MAVSMILVKKFTYRGNSQEEWSNRYFLDGADPADASEWLDIFTPLAAAEKAVYSSASAIVRAYGYTSDAPSATTVWIKDLETAGPTIPGTKSISAVRMAGDQAACVWWKTDRLTSHGKAIYLRKFFHGGEMDASGGDDLSAASITAYETFATLLASGAGVDGRHIRGRGESSDVIFDSGVLPHVTTRTLKRRGKRPTPAP